MHTEEELVPGANAPPFGLDATILLAVQVSVLTAAVRAILGTHPDREQVRSVFDQLISQMQAHPGFLLAQAGTSDALRSCVEVLFRPPVELQKYPQEPQ